MKRIVLLGTVLALIFTSLFSCASHENVMTYGEHAVTENEYIYMLSTYKYLFSQSYEGFSDSAEYYGKVISDGVTYGEMLDDVARYNIKVSLISETLFDEYGFELDDEETAEVDEYIEGLIENAGGRTALNKSLGKYGINYKMLRELNIGGKKTEALCTKLFESGKLTLTDSDREEFLEDFYVHFLHLYISSENTENADVVSGLLEDGMSFRDVYEEYSEDRYYDSGYYMRRDSDFFTGVTEAAFDLDVGEYTSVASDFGVHFILRLETEDGAYRDEEYADFFTDFDETASENVYAKFITEKLSEVEVNEDLAGKHSVENAEMNSTY